MLLLVFLGSGHFAAAQEDNKIKWISFEEAIELGEKDPKPIVMDMYTDWCGWCKRMDKATFENEHVVKTINSYFYAVKFNAEQKASITAGGKEYKFVARGRRGYHELAAELMNGRMSYPTIVFLDDRFNKVQAIPGYRGPEEFDQMAVFFGTKAYEQTQWETFLTDVYVSPFPEGTPTK